MMPTPDKILDAHTHLSGPGSGESAGNILDCLDGCGVAKAFVFAPLLDVRSWQLTGRDLATIRAHNDYCAELCGDSPERLLALCVLSPAPDLAGGSLAGAVDLMVAEAERCRRELGVRGVKMVPQGWYPNDPALLPLYRALADLGMYVVFHSGIFVDGRQGSFCRPTFYEAVHLVPGLRAQLAHLSWPWVDECIAVLRMEPIFQGNHPGQWQLKADVSFGMPEDWQLEAWQRAIGNLPPSMLVYGSDVFWPCTPERYGEQYLRPQLGLFEVAASRAHLAPAGSPERAALRQAIFFDNAWAHWRAAARDAET